MDTDFLSFYRPTLFLAFASKMSASSACLLGSGLSSTKPYLCKSSTLPSLGKRSKAFLTRASLDRKQFDGRRDFLNLMLGNAELGASTLLGNGKALADEQGVSSSRFLEYLDKDRVTKVDLFENGTIAIVEAVSAELGNRVQRVRVQLPGLNQELLQKSREKNIDFAAHDAQENSGSSWLAVTFGLNQWWLSGRSFFGVSQKRELLCGVFVKLCSSNVHSLLCRLACFS